MSFYKDKLEKYSKIQLTPELLDGARKSIIYSMEKHYKKLIEDLKWEEALNARMYDGLTLSGLTALENVKNMEHELSFVSVLNTEDFYNYQKNVEALALSKFKRGKEENQKETNETLTKYRQKKGIAGKMSVLFGTNEEKVRKYLTKYNELSSYLTDVGDAIDEFKNLTDEEVKKYIIGRYAVENKFAFDEKEFENYINKLQEEKQEGAEPSNS